MLQLKRILPLVFVFIWLVLTTPAAANEPVVRAVMFWSSTCPHCHYVLEEVLPPLQQKYGAQLDILLIEVKTQEDWERLLHTAAAFDLPPEYVGVPFLIIGDKVLIGSGQIPAELPGLIEQHLATGGVDYPSVPTLTDLLPTPTPDPETRTLATPYAKEAFQQPEVAAPAPAAQPSESGPPAPSSTVQPTPDGFELAIAIMVGMVGALLYTGVATVRTLKKPSVRSTSAWSGLAILILAVAGLGVAGYMAYVETQAVPAVCGPVGDCNAVQSSPYARLFGLLPIGVLGVIGYVAILAAWLWGRLRSDGLASYTSLLVFGLALFGVLFSLYLTYLEPFVIRAVCMWCLTSAIIITLLLLLSLNPAFQVMRIHKVRSYK